MTTPTPKFEFLRCEEGLRVEVGGEASHDAATIARVDEEWRAACRKNPRLFDGPMLAVQEVNAAAGVIRCTHDAYRFHACRESTLLGVKGVLISECPVDGRPRVLVARRSVHCLRYPGMWEVGPGGGVNPRTDAPVLRDISFAFAVARECEEELGFPIEACRCGEVGLLHDPLAVSVDVVIVVRFGRGQEPCLAQNAKRDTPWESFDPRWLTLRGWRWHGDASPLSPPSLVLLEALVPLLYS